jgi:hypothetical protein
MNQFRQEEVNPDTLKQGGGGRREEGSQATMSLGEAIHEIRLRRAEIEPHAPPPPPQMEAQKQPPLENNPVAMKLGGERGPTTKAWTEHATWESLFHDEEAYKEYWNDVQMVINKLDLDWSGVRAELKEQLYDSREWAGRINLEGGKPKIVELVPSPFSVNEGPLPPQATAMVPAEVVEKLEIKPALFLFHTHPGEVGGSTLPSPTDVAGSMWIAYTNQHAANLVISPYGVFMYGPSMGLRTEIWKKNNNPVEAKLTIYKRIADMLAALEGSRSWADPWTLKTYARMLERYNVDYVIFPTDKYACEDFRKTFTAGINSVDYSLLYSYHKRIEKLEPSTTKKKPRSVTREER